MPRQAAVNLFLRLMDLNIDDAVIRFRRRNLKIRNVNERTRKLGSGVQL
ncbi:274_t:CDS:2 [Paraglomus brasilianum]|uniref:274_t:CDS:1 n=1 Tax=Paraglomus brasilianum TaxID=144538 RepID=A0A9N9BMN3_9GLOM|nr:274_t:CDS:2 [Paraglomus brasilianum]